MPFRQFTLKDFRNQMKTIRTMGSLKDLMKQIPGLERLLVTNVGIDPDENLLQMEAILDSMTHDERKHPESIDYDRCERIARGAGTDTSDVNRLLQNFEYAAIFAQKQAAFGTTFSVN